MNFLRKKQNAQSLGERKAVGNKKAGLFKKPAIVDNIFFCFGFLAARKRVLAARAVFPLQAARGRTAKIKESPSLRV